mmetsp:Transcript_7050/g.23638  ORF Transcript_7050/g.23638 Transcript_7050/m.23638 type:complete len:218 (+) Transcript_7050:1813-2466(+)
MTVPSGARLGLVEFLWLVFCTATGWVLLKLLTFVFTERSSFDDAANTASSDSVSSASSLSKLSAAAIGTSAGRAEAAAPAPDPLLAGDTSLATGTSSSSDEDSFSSSPPVVAGGTLEEALSVFGTLERPRARGGGADGLDGSGRVRVVCVVGFGFGRAAGRAGCFPFGCDRAALVILSLASDETVGPPRKNENTGEKMLLLFTPSRAAMFLSFFFPP